ncbi:unnamed protein product [Lupinus luteus]|uniref:NB-ARC domain-containing protein n=1 Tax=Lupinus luteus TaxID=3873 RepID=A0AAV1Y2R9_LUPLU
MSSIHGDKSNNNKGKLISRYLCGFFNHTVTVDDGIEKEHNVVAVVENAETPGLQSLHSEVFVHFKSRNLIYKQLLEAMEHNYMTGLYGIKGIGKTTLAKQVCLELQKSMKFGLVIFINVANKSSSDIKEIQDMIADKMGLSLKGKNEWERTETILNRLMNGDRTLLILDDVTENINTQELGFPSRTNSNMKCRVLVTSLDQIYFKPIGCQTSIQLHKLSKIEAWISFKNQAGIDHNSSEEMLNLGKQITDKCEGLPIIAAIASILKSRPLQVWEYTLSYLEYGRYNIKDWIKAFAFVNSHHDYLNITKAQRLYIVLSMFPTGVSIEFLTRLGMGLGIFGDVKKYYEVRSEVLRLKNILINFHVCFEDKRGYVQTNDLFLSLFRYNGLSLCNIRPHEKVVSEEKLHYLYYADLNAKEMEFDHISTGWYYDETKVAMLIINVKASNSVEISDAFFDKMTRLQVLSLSSNNLHPTHALKLPSSLQSLTNICSLLLSHWKFSDISILGELQSLDTLDFDDCLISEFPKEISTLKLRLLSLKRCQIERNNPFEVIERCLSLQELYYKDNEVSNNIDSVDEAEEIHQSGTFPTLNRYHLQGGEDESSISKCVCLPNIDALVSEATFKYLIKGAEIVHLKEIRGEWRNLIPDIVSSMNDVVELSLESCSKVECLINTTKHDKSQVVSSFSRLVELKLKSMDNLTQLCSGDHPYDFFKSLNRLSIEHCAHFQGILFKSKVNLCNLKSVNIFHCQDLTSLFMLSTAQSLGALEELRIRECKLLTDIVEDENDDHKSNGLIFPKLETLEIEGCSNLFNISIEYYPLSTSRMKNSSPTIDSKENQQDPSKDHHHKGPMSSISQGLNILVVHNIKKLVLKDVDKIEYLFTLSTASSMMLEILIVESCNVLKHIIDIEDGSDRKKLEDVFKKIKEFSVSSCDQLECMFGKYNAAKDDQSYSEIHIHLPALEKLILQNLPKFSLYSITWTSLKEFVLVQCPYFIINPISDMMIHFHSRKLLTTTTKEDIREIYKHFFTLETLKIDGYEAESIFCVSGVQIIGQVSSLQELKVIDIECCSQLKEIVEEDKELGNVDSSQSHLCFPKLEKLVVYVCWELKRLMHASSVPNVVTIEIGLCPNLRVIFFPSNVNSPQPCFQNLEKLLVEDCKELKSLIRAYDVPNIKTITIVSCNYLQTMFPSSVLLCTSLRELKVIDIQHCSNLKEIIEEDKELGNVDSSQSHLRFPKLETLVINGCRELKCLMHASSVPNVVTIEIVACPILEGIFFPSSILRMDENLGNVNSPKPCFPKLEKLVVKECEELKSLILACDVPNIKTVMLEGCDALEVIFADSVSSCIPELMHLKIQKCDSLEKIFKEDKNSLRKPCFPKLQVLVVSNSYDLKGLIYVSNDAPNLELLIMIEVEEVEELIGGDGDDDILIAKIKVGLPKLKLVIFSKATFDENEKLQSLQLFVHNSPKQSLKETATFKETVEKLRELFDIELHELLENLPYDNKPESEVRLNQSETYTDKENEGSAMNIQDFKDGDLIGLFQSVKEDGDGQTNQPSISAITENNLVHLKDIDIF